MSRLRSLTQFCLDLGLLASLFVGCRSQPPQAPAERAASEAEIIALEGVRIIDGSGRAAIEDGTILISGHTLQAVGSSRDITVPVGATRPNVRGKTVLPGLISDHSHLGNVDGTTADPKNYTRANFVRQLAQFEAYGVTTVMSLGLNGPLFYEVQRDMRAGKVPGADFYGADRGLGVPDAAPPVSADFDQLYRPSTPEQARQMVRESAARAPSLIKIWVDDFHGSLPMKMSPDIYRAIIDEAHLAHLRVAAHVYYLADAKSLVDAGIDILAHGVRDRAVDGELIEAMKAHGTWYIPTLELDESFYVYAEHPAWMDTQFFKSAVQPALAAEFADPAWQAKTLADPQSGVERQALHVNEANLQTLRAAGVQIGFGTDSGANPLRIPGLAEHRELELMTEAGLSPLEAITLATSQAAALLNLQDRGLLAPGNLADLLIVDGCPDLTISDVDRIVAVWHRGVQTRSAVATFR